MEEKSTMSVKTIDPDAGLMRLIEKTKPALAFDESADYAKWRNEVKRKFIDLTGLDSIAENAATDPKFTIERDEDKGEYRLIRFTFESEPEEVVPCYLLIPNTGKKKYPVCITLQGHSTGFHLSINEAKFESDADKLPREAIAVQAVKRGFAALAIEQRGLGERRTSNPDRTPKSNCWFASQVALELGRTIIGERVWDISRAIDMLAKFPQCDTDMIAITGGSGGGTASYYAACYDERIKVCAPVCAFCAYPESIMHVTHCYCNYIPAAYKNFDMQDLCCLIAPHPLAIIAGKLDPIFPIGGVRRGYETVKKVYAAAGAPSACSLHETERAHWWVEDIVWQAVEEACAKLEK